MRCLVAEVSGPRFKELFPGRLPVPLETNAPLRPPAPSVRDFSAVGKQSLPNLYVRDNIRTAQAKRFGIYMLIHPRGREKMLRVGTDH